MELQKVEFDDLKVGDVISLDKNYGLHDRWIIDSIHPHPLGSSMEFMRIHTDGGVHTVLNRQSWNYFIVEKIIPKTTNLEQDIELLDRMTGLDLDRFASHRLQMMRTFDYPDEEFRIDLKAALLQGVPMAQVRAHGTPLVKVCSHKWVTDSFFSARKYETCSICGAKKEDL